MKIILFCFKLRHTIFHYQILFLFECDNMPSLRFTCCINYIRTKFNLWLQVGQAANCIVVVFCCLLLFCGVSSPFFQINHFLLRLPVFLSSVSLRKQLLLHSFIFFVVICSARKMVTKLGAVYVSFPKIREQRQSFPPSDGQANRRE